MSAFNGTLHLFHSFPSSPFNCITRVMYMNGETLSFYWHFHDLFLKTTVDTLRPVLPPNLNEGDGITSTGWYPVVKKISAQNRSNIHMYTRGALYTQPPSLFYQHQCIRTTTKPVLSTSVHVLFVKLVNYRVGEQITK